MSDKPYTPAATNQASDREKHEACISMLKAYYDAIESRLGQNIVAYVGAIGWLLTSKDARAAMTSEWALWPAVIVSLVLLVGYIFNIRHYVRRWREIRETVLKLDYMPEAYYARYEVPGYTAITYSLPIALLCIGLVVIMFFCFFGYIPFAK